MHIFIDESGTFAKPTGDIGISLVGALIVPEGRKSEIERRYAMLSRGFPRANGEVKGKLLNEKQISTVIEMLVRSEVVFEASAFDTSQEDPDSIKSHQFQSGLGVTKNLTDDHHPNLRKEACEVRHQIESLSAPLYLQTLALLDLVESVIRNSTLYYCQRRPRELGAFHWVFDAKERNRTTPWERLFSIIVAPLLQSRFLREPIIHLVEGDYSHFERFRTERPDWLPSKEAEEVAFDLTRVCRESQTFAFSFEPGLELVDIVLSGTRRALVGNLGPDGWLRIPRLMIHRPRPYVRFVGVSGGFTKGHYESILRQHFSVGGKSMFPGGNAAMREPDR